MKDNTGMGKLLIGAAVASALALSGWTLTAVANIPKEYTSIEKFEQLRHENREDHKEILEMLRAMHDEDNE